MLLVAAVLFAAAGPPTVAPIGDMPVFRPNAGQPQDCPATSRYQASRRGRTPKAQKLNALPDADLYRAVYRRIGRCEAPVIIKYGVTGR